jgi:NAD(P)-dependent dehydrogenase (short-subunit alcohol dehydrogenase family)
MAAQFDLTGQRIAITGAGGGIGSTTARLVAEMGADVMLSDIEPPQALADYIASKGRETSATSLDVTDRDAVEAWAADCGAVTGLIDCAAICPFDDWNDDGWDEVAARVFNINLHGPLNLTRAFMNGMIERGNGGRIALIGSIAGRIGGVAAAPHYAMAKGGIHGFVRWASRRGAPHNILINAVAPGPVATPMTQSQSFDGAIFPMKRIAEADEIAGPLAFLVSPAASYIAGAVLDINGAMHFS